MLVFCDEESFQLFEFFRTLIHDKTIRTLILSTIKNMASKRITNCQNKQNLKLFYRKLTNTLDLQLKEVLEAMLSSSGLEALVASDLPFVFNQTMKNSDFNILGKDLISSYSSTSVLIQYITKWQHEIQTYLHRTILRQPASCSFVSTQWAALSFCPYPVLCVRHRHEPGRSQN